MASKWERRSAFMQRLCLSALRSYCSCLKLQGARTGLQSVGETRDFETGPGLRDRPPHILLRAALVEARIWHLIVPAHVTGRNLDLGPSHDSHSRRRASETDRAERVRNRPRNAGRGAGSRTDNGQPCAGGTCKASHGSDSIPFFHTRRPPQSVIDIDPADSCCPVDRHLSSPLQQIHTVIAKK
ncbi:hypothetical protein DFH27DRAFT_133526 [Peziza echinospora]|nr:hypothetical protein DFH27DRAFT_133526 [Peziza echinospora]